MKKLSLAIACSSLILSPLAFANTDAEGTTYVTGNLQYQTSDMHGTNGTSTVEAGHTFTTGTTVFIELDGIQLGTLQNTTENSPAAMTLGLEQSYSINSSLWIAAGYQHVTVNGEALEYRPLVKIGYDFDNGISISNRTRMHIDAIDDNDDTRMDNAIAYSLPNTPLNVQYNNVYMFDTEAMDHELRATWTRSGVQPYAEYRGQGTNIDDSKVNHAFVIGASYAF